MTQIGRLNKRIEILTPTVTKTRSGEARAEFTSLDTVWGSSEGLSSRDILQAQQSNVIATHRIRIRYRDDFDHTARVKVNGGSEMEIAAVAPSESDTMLTILAREVT